MPADTNPFEVIPSPAHAGQWVVRDVRDQLIMPGTFTRKAKAYEAAMIHAHMMRLGVSRPEPSQDAYGRSK